MASLAALLLLVAWNMSEIHGFAGVVRVAPKSDVFVLLTCFLLTVFFDMIVAVSVGFVLAAILFMRRMSELTESRIQLDSSQEGTETPLPAGVVLYEINGPLFFGAAQKAMNALNTARTGGFRVLVIHLGRVPAIDATGLVALENAISAIVRTKRSVVLAGPLPKPHEVFDKARLAEKHRGLHIAADLETALRVAKDLADQGNTPAPGSGRVATPT
jgi:SulP family sulfate permease